MKIDDDFNDTAISSDWTFLESDDGVIILFIFVVILLSVAVIQFGI